MPITVVDHDVTIPDGITDLEAFRAWAKSDDFPERGRYSFYHGRVWVDLSMEAGNSHNRVKSAFVATLGTLVDDEDLGQYFGDGMALTHIEAGLSTVADGVFVSHESIDGGAVVRIAGTDDDDFVELLGSPDMVLEVVSKSSVPKDTEHMPDLYWQAGIAEYWRVDARGGDIAFDIFRRGPKGYTASRHQDGGWIKSGVFRRSFRLTRGANRRGDPTYKLEVK